MSMKRQTIVLMTVCMTGLLVSACGAREVFIQGKQAPDEFAVYTRAPLSLPPDYTLRVPEPGTERPQEENPSAVAEQVVLGTTVSTLPQQQALAGSPGVQALLRDTGALQADPSIRTLVDQETSILAEEDQTVMDRIMFWGVPNEYGVVVDPALESKRIQENQALGQPLTTGDVPVIAKKRKGMLEDLF